MARELAPDPALLDAVHEAQALGDAGALGDAERILLDLVPTARELGTDNELYVFGTLMVVYSRSGRHFEALVLARTLAERAIAVESYDGAANLYAAYCAELLELDARDLMPAALERLAGVLAELPDDEALNAREEYSHARCGLALLEGDEAEARAQCAAFAAIDIPDETRPWRKELLVAMVHAEVEAVFGHHDLALQWLARADAIDHPERRVRLGQQLMEVELALGLGDLTRAREAAARTLAHLRELQDDVALASERIRVGAQLAAWSEGPLEDPRQAQSCFDLTTAAVFQRMAQLEASIRQLPELGLEDTDEATLLIDLRKRFTREQGELMKKVARFLQLQPDFQPAVDLGDAKGHVVICAWCERLRAEDHTWLPIGHLVPRDGPLRISHGICPDCSKRLGV